MYKIVILLVSIIGSFLYFQIDICPEEIGNNVMPAVGLCGDLTSVLQQVTFLYSKICLKQPLKRHNKDLKDKW